MKIEGVEIVFPWNHGLSIRASNALFWAFSSERKIVDTWKKSIGIEVKIDFRSMDNEKIKVVLRELIESKHIRLIQTKWIGRVVHDEIVKWLGIETEKGVLL